MRRSCWQIGAILLLLAGFLSGPAEDKMEAEVYPLGLNDFEQTEAIVKGMISPDGKLVADRQNNRLILLDLPARHAAVRELLRRLKPQTKHVRIRVSFLDSGSAGISSVDVQGRVRAGPVVVQTPGHTGSRSSVTMQQTTVTATSNITQEILVISGGKAHIRIGADIPYADWIWGYGLQQGWWTGSIQWKEVGAQMVVEPYVIGDQIRIRLTPEFSYMLDARRLTTAIEKLTTEVVVGNGQVIELGGLPVQDRNFYDRFLIGYAQGGERRTLRIVLHPTIEDFTPSSPQ